MKIRLLAVGSRMPAWVEAGVDEYRKRLPREMPFEIVEIPPGARGKNVFVGSPEQVADYMEEWFQGEACDGFTVMPPYIPGALDDFCELVIPILRKRGLFRSEYTGNTLREHLGLPRPESRYAKQSGSAAAE